MDLFRRLKPTHLRLVAEIARRQKLQLAAEALAMSQPAASRMLADIEQETGAPLFIRHPRWMEPTPLGEAFLRHVRVILWEMESLQSEVESLNSGQMGEVRVGAVTGPAMGFLMPALQYVKEQSPRIEATIEVSPSVQLVRGLQEGRFDFIVARLPPEHDRRDLHLYPARSEDVSLLVRDSHPLAGRAEVPLEALRHYPWVVQERGSPIRRAVEDGFVAEGVEVPRNIYNSSSLLVVLALLASAEVIAPQSSEVAEILTGPELGARLVTLNVASRFTVSPYFVITNRGKQLPRAAQTVLEEVLRRI
ncbi:LysR family transcriptional regulator [Pseudooceanicola sp. CBS1P-1]|uniref:LysR family transcriptional regulator n=1 Tax=Pseudooceanicola albus TaxID=2692189 RepID=A0A6L7GA61_9RHOB|nr:MULTISPECIES: LysR family transcriptional regulator [Pseudooceanicola]MBT9382866.1 LysR family transcriptional regulator [Pseudooceanicola endophyticus]MXN20210.1 LysR family transcriptional regulator [Pseudooceanicola albus]